jgi:hypothetical protein
VLDSDPSAIFLALYRCLEALYAYSHSQSLKAKLNVNVPWPELARTLEDVLDWSPREEPSLAAILTYANLDRLEEVAASFKEEIPKEATPSNFVAKRIYNLRNSVVHYRPFQQAASREQPDWSRVTEALAILIFDIYDQVSLSSHQS